MELQVSILGYSVSEENAALQKAPHGRDAVARRSGPETIQLNFRRLQWRGGKIIEVL